MNCCPITFGLRKPNLICLTRKNQGIQVDNPAARSLFFSYRSYIQFLPTQEVLMAENDMDLVQRLSEENPIFRKLHEQHLLFEKQLQDMDDRTYLTPEEDLERKKIQKLKLAGKDEMEAILRDYRQ
jgi:hypothetical protein